MYRKPNASFGPLVAREGDALVAKCYAGHMMCTFLIGGTCTHVRPSQKVEGLPETPDWCEMKVAMLRDVAATGA